jgi:hypothetical protein
MNYSMRKEHKNKDRLNNYSGYKTVKNKKSLAKLNSSNEGFDTVNFIERFVS